MMSFYKRLGFYFFMSLSVQQKNLIGDIDRKVISILENGENENALLVQILEDIPEIKNIMNSATAPHQSRVEHHNEYTRYTPFEKPLDPHYFLLYAVK